MVRAAEDRTERGAGEQKHADEQQQRAEDGRAGGPDRDADGAAQNLPEIAALVAPEREHQAEEDDDDAGAERPNGDEGAARDHQRADRDERDRRDPRRPSD